MHSVPATSGPRSPERRQPRAVAAAMPVPHRAVVPFAPADRAAGDPIHRRNAFVRPSAAFLAQLIAANRNLPQARERRRAEPRDAIAAYAAAARAA